MISVSQQPEWPETQHDISDFVKSLGSTGVEDALSFAAEQVKQELVQFIERRQKYLGRRAQDTSRTASQDESDWWPGLSLLPDKITRHGDKLSKVDGVGEGVMGSLRSSLDVLHASLLLISAKLCQKVSEKSRLAIRVQGSLPQLIDGFLVELVQTINSQLDESRGLTDEQMTALDATSKALSESAVGFAEFSLGYLGGYSSRLGLPVWSGDRDDPVAGVLGEHYTRLVELLSAKRFGGRSNPGSLPKIRFAKSTSLSAPIEVPSSGAVPSDHCDQY